MKPKGKVRSISRPDRNSDKTRSVKNAHPRSPRDNSPPPSAESGTNLFGLTPVIERLRTRPRTISKIYILESARLHRLGELRELARAFEIPVEWRSRAKLDQMAGDGMNHQGVIAAVAPAEFASAEDLIKNIGPTTLFLVLDGIEDPRNFGAILRTAECAGVTGVFIPERRAVGLTETVAKASAGAIEHVPVARVTNINRLTEELKNNDVWIVGAAGEAAMAHSDWDWSRPTALVLGNEEKGIHRLTAENCDVLVQIPMYGKIESLNVSVAAGVILFEAQRQRSNIEKS
jgi:23S rRNA (guanosine2251-2'-O)-methyltransferase